MQEDLTRGATGKPGAALEPQHEPVIGGIRWGQPVMLLIIGLVAIIALAQLW